MAPCSRRVPSSTPPMELYPARRLAYSWNLPIPPTWSGPAHRSAHHLAQDRLPEEWKTLRWVPYVMVEFSAATDVCPLATCIY
jgi:hypothetical protein